MCSSVPAREFCSWLDAAGAGVHAGAEGPACVGAPAGVQCGS